MTDHHRDIAPDHPKAWTRPRWARPKQQPSTETTPDEPTRPVVRLVDRTLPPVWHNNAAR